MSESTYLYVPGPDIYSGVFIHLRDKVTVVTGASRGLGKALVLTLAGEGCDLFICGRDRKALSDVCKEARRKGAACAFSVFDVKNQKKVDAFIQKVLKSRKRIDILINNAGICEDLGPIETVSKKVFDGVMQTNVYSVFYFLRKVVPVMKMQKSGAIVNVSSYAGKRGIPRLSSYCASKFAVVGLTQSVAKELEGSGVTCIAACLGGMKTDMRRRLFGDEDAGKQQTPELVAGVIRDVLTGKIEVPSGGDVVLRYGKVTAINPPVTN